MDTPPEQARREAADVNLTRQPATDAARDFTADVLADAVLPHLARKRPLGAAGITAMRRDVGTMLAGIMRPGLQGSPVRVHQSPSGRMWRDAPLGRDRFMAIADALAAVGMVGRLPSIRYPDAETGGAKALAALYWPTYRLTVRAAEHGVTTETRKADWRSDPDERARPAGLDEADLATCRPLDGVPLGMTPCMERTLQAMRAELAGINRRNEAAEVRGAGRHVSLVRRFRHSLAFGGRFYAPVSTMAENDRLRITIDGQPAAEIDVKASQLTVLLGFAGHRAAPVDAYAFPDLPRDVVKAWTVQTLGSGRPARRWSDTQAAAMRGWPVREVGRTVLARYPFLADLPALVPHADLQGIPEGRREWAAGQWLVQREAATMHRAVANLSRVGVFVLPVHDSLVVPCSAIRAAKDALRAAFEAGTGIAPQLVVSPG